MGKATQSTLSKKNPYWIPKNRYYELKYFCLQYWEWQRRRAQLDGLATRENREPTEEEAFERAELDDKIKMVMRCIDSVTFDKELYGALLKGVTKGLSYDTMAVRNVLPVGRECYYVLYRKFFWLLDSARK